MVKPERSGTLAVSDYARSVIEPADEEVFTDLEAGGDEFLAALRLEGLQRRQAMAREPAMAALRKQALAAGPPNMGVPATENAVDDIRRMLAMASFRPSYQEYEWFDLCYIYQGKLCEMRHSGCLDCPCDGSGTCCDAACQVEIDMVSLNGWQAQKDFLARRDIRRYALSVFSWYEIPVPDEARQAAAASNFWPGVHRLHGYNKPLPIFHPDGTIQRHPGLLQPGGWWGVHARFDGRPVPETLADRIVNLVGQRGTKSVLAQAAQFDGEVNGFNAQLKRLRPELRARGVDIISRGRQNRNGGAEEFEVVALADCEKTPHAPHGLMKCL